jgi:hypothetical protein
MAYDPESLLDQISLVHGPHTVLARYFEIAENALCERGVRLRFRADFDRLVEINHEHRDSWPAFIPMFDPSHNRLRLDDSFWVEALDEHGFMQFLPASLDHRFDKARLQLFRGVQVVTA